MNGKLKHILCRSRLRRDFSFSRSFPLLKSLCHCRKTLDVSTDEAANDGSGNEILCAMSLVRNRLHLLSKPPLLPAVGSYRERDGVKMDLRTTLIIGIRLLMA